MKRIILAIAQDEKEVNFIKSKYKKNLTWIPLNIETILYFDTNNLNYIDPNNY